MPAKKGKGKGKSGKPRGRRSWAKGRKLELLLSFEEEYLNTADTGSIYSRVTAQFLDKYGYDLPFDTEPAEDFVAEIPNIAVLPYEEQIVEQARRDDIYDRLRLKISAWMRHRFLHKKTDQDMVADILDTMRCLTTERPRRRTAMNIYWAENYKSRIRDEFRTHWKTAKLTVSPDIRMSMCSEYVKTKYEDETEEFRRNLEQRADTEYAQAMDEYNKRGALDGTPEAYAQAWEESENFLPTFVDAIAKKFGMSVSLLLVGPLGSEQGKIEMRSVHSNNAGSMTSLIWPQYDKVGFTNMQASLIRYGETVFSPEECKRRIPTSEVGATESKASPSLSDTVLPASALSPNVDNGQASTIANEEAMNLIQDVYPSVTVPMNFEAATGVVDTQGEFMTLLGQEWNGEALLWNATAIEQPLCNNPTYDLQPLPTQPPIPSFPQVEVSFASRTPLPLSEGLFPVIGSASTRAFTFAMPTLVGTPTMPGSTATHTLMDRPTGPEREHLSIPPTPLIPIGVATMPGSIETHSLMHCPTIPSHPLTPPTPLVSNGDATGPTNLLGPLSTPLASVASATTRAGSALATESVSASSIPPKPAMPTAATLPSKIPAILTTPVTPTTPPILRTGVPVPASAPIPTTPVVSGSATATVSVPAPVISAMAPAATTTSVPVLGPPIPTTLSPVITAVPFLHPAMSAIVPPATVSEPVQTTPVIASESTALPQSLIAPLSSDATTPPPPGSPSQQSQGKENALLLPKKRTRKEPATNEGQTPPPSKKRTQRNATDAADTPPANEEGRPQRASKLPPHLATAGYVPPSKGSRKKAISKKKK